jgi:hypothetical protein
MDEKIKNKIQQDILNKSSELLGTIQIQTTINSLKFEVLKDMIFSYMEKSSDYLETEFNDRLNNEIECLDKNVKELIKQYLI